MSAADRAAACGYQGFGSGDHPTGPGCVLPKGHGGPCSTQERPAAYWHDLHDLIAACEFMFTGVETKDEPDDGFVMLPGITGDMTFGMIRKARAAHDVLTQGGERCSLTTSSHANRQITHRVELILGVHAENDEAAGKIAEAFYEKFAKQVRDVEGVLWLLPVANIKPKERGDAVL